jgi:hypothetical protein
MRFYIFANYGAFVELRHRARAREIELSGKIGKEGAFELEGMAGGKATGQISDVVRDGERQGTWMKPDGSSPASFSAKEAKGAPPDYSKPVSCERYRAKEFGWTYDYSFAISRGAVKDFAVGFEAEREGNEQRRSYSLEDFLPIRVGAGLVLSAREEKRGSAKTPTCTIRIVDDADHLYLGFAQSGGEKDDCRSGHGAVFCSLRGSATALVVDCKTGKYKGVRD